jgi:hypothetical protein
VDFTSPVLPPGMNAEKIHAGIAVAMKQMAQAVWKGVGMSTIVSGTLASAIVEYRSEQNRLPDRSRRSLGRLLALI